MASRPRRGQSAREKQKAAALEALKDVVAGKTKRSEQVVIEDEEEVFDTVTEEEYRAIVEERRKSSEFVVDDDGLGYYDDGEEHLFDDGQAAPAALVNGPKKAHGALSSEAIERARRLDEAKKGPRKKVSSMFLGSRGTVVGPKSISGADDADVGMDDFLTNALQNLQDSEKDAADRNPFKISGAAPVDAEEARRKRQKKTAKSKQALLARMLLDPKGMQEAEKHLDAQQQSEADVVGPSSGGSFDAEGATSSSAGQGFDDAGGFDDDDADGFDDSGGFDDELPSAAEADGDGNAGQSTKLASPTKRGAAGISGNSGVTTDSASDGADSRSSQRDSHAQMFKRRRMAARLKREQAAARAAAREKDESARIEAEAARKASVAKRIAEKRAAAQARKSGAAAAARRTEATSTALGGAATARLNAGNGWESVATSSAAQDSSSSSSSTSASGLGKLPVHKAPIKLPSGETVEREVLNFFWLDVFESTNNPGHLYVFGKIRAADGTYQSCCVAVPNVERHLHFLPRTHKRSDRTAAVEMADVWQEVKDLFSKRFPNEASAFKSRTVKRKYAFELPDVPTEETEYLQVLYPARLPRFDSTMQGDTFSRIFGANTSCLENFIIQRDIMGPCWLQIEAPQAMSGSASWCKYEVSVENMGMVHKLRNGPPAPPLVVASLAMKTCVNPATGGHEICVASVLVSNTVQVDGPTANTNPDSHFSLVCPPPAGSKMLPVDFKRRVANDPRAKATITTLPNERALLNIFCAKLHHLDPDVIVGHNIRGFDIDVLTHRMEKSKIKMWSKISRFRQRDFPRAIRKAQGKVSYSGNVCCGRLICDTYLTARELIRETSYSLTALAASKLKQTRHNVNPADVPVNYEEAQRLFALVRHTENDAWLTLGLMHHLEVLPLTKQLTNLSGNLWSRSLGSARAERIEYLLLHEFTRRGFIVPDKERIAKRAPGAPRRAKAAYGGGLVLEPKKGLYDKSVLLLDFNSLYPSIIQEYNICFSTVERAKTGGMDENGKAQVKSDEARLRREFEDAAELLGAEGEFENAAEAEEARRKAEIPALPDSGQPFGVLPTVIQQLVRRRGVVKRLMNAETDAEKRTTLNTRQLALKILANSMYGCLGFSNSRFYARPIAALVTHTGREILQDTVELTQGLGYDVIYGDTDSIMVNTGSSDWETVQKIGRQVKKEVNKKYKLLEIEIDGVYQMMLLLKKKKYAALAASKGDDGVVHVKKEMKGLDMVRRDWCPLSKEAGEQVLDFILSGEPSDQVVDKIHEYLENLARKIRSGDVPLSKFIITKGLNKAPHEYPNGDSQPHLQVAKQMIRQGKPVNVGDHIPYVICRKAESSAGDSDGSKPVVEESGKSVAMRAKHPLDVAADASEGVGADRLDLEWYISMQILPPIGRLCEPIQSTSLADIARALGLDAAKYEARYNALTSDQDRLNFENFYSGAAGADDDEAFKDAEPLTVQLPLTKEQEQQAHPVAATATFQGVLTLSDDKTHASTHRLPVPPNVMANQVALQARRHIGKFYEGWLVCDEPTCGTQTRQLCVQKNATGQACVNRGCRGTMVPKYRAADLYTQLKYFETMFDVSRAKEKVKHLNDMSLEQARSAQPDGTAAPKPELLNPDWPSEAEVHDEWDAVYGATTLQTKHSAFKWVPGDLFKMYTAAE